MELGRPEGALSYTYHSSQCTHSSQKKLNLQQEEGRFSSCLEIIQPMRNCYNPEIFSSELLNKQPLPPSTFPLFFCKRILLLLVSKLWDSLVAQTVKIACNGSGRCLGKGNGNSLQYSCLENTMDRGAWWATVHGVTELNTTEQFHLSFTFGLQTMVYYSFHGPKGKSCGIPK